jgi:phosphoketolase
VRTVIAILLLVAFGCASAPMDEDDEPSTDEVAVALDGVPAHLREAALAACPGLKAERAAKETEEGVRYVEISGRTADGAPVDIVLTEAGEVVAVEVTVEVAASPENLRAAAAARVPGLSLSRAERLLKKGVTTWEFRGTAAGRVYEIVVAESGEVLEVED